MLSTNKGRKTKCRGTFVVGIFSGQNSRNNCNYVKFCGDHWDYHKNSSSSTFNPWSLTSLFQCFFGDVVPCRIDWSALFCIFFSIRNFLLFITWPAERMSRRIMKTENNERNKKCWQWRDNFRRVRISCQRKGRRKKMLERQWCQVEN